MIQKVGRHWIRCGDVMQGTESLVGTAGVDFIFVDPPRGASKMQLWYTKEGLGQDGVTVPAFMAQLFETATRAAHRSTVMFLVHGVRWDKTIREQAEQRGWNMAGTVPVSGGRLYIASREPLELSEQYLDPINGTRGKLTVETALLSLGVRGRSLLDLTCGNGDTARFARKHNMVFYGNDFSPQRLSKVIKILRNG